MSSPGNPSRPRALAQLAAAAMLWSIGGLLIKLVAWHPVAIAGARSAISALFLLAVIGRPRFTWSLPQVGGAVAYAAMVTLFVSANKLTTAANAVLLQYTSPVYVALLGAWFLGERTTRLDWGVLAAVLGGMVLFFLDRVTLTGMFGNILAILSGLATAIMVLCLRKQKDGSPVESVLLGNILTALIGLPFILGGLGNGPGAAGWLSLLVLGVLQLGLPYVLYARAIKKVTALEASLVPVIEPLLNPVWVYLVQGEAPGGWSLLGGAIVLLVVTGRCALAAVPSPNRAPLPGRDQHGCRPPDPGRAGQEPLLPAD